MTRKFFCVILIKKDKGEYVLEKYINKLTKVLLNDCVSEEFYKIYGVDKSFTSWLDRFIPEIKDCLNQQQNNPWHKYNVLDHILHSCEEMNKMTKGLDKSVRTRLVYTMFLHDIGKPATHIVRNKDGKLIDSFFNHNVESCKVASRVLNELGIENKEIDIILKLIYKHDIFMFIRDGDVTNPYHRQLTKDLVKDEIKDLQGVGDGWELLRELVMVGRADNLAQNEKMTASSLKLLDKFDDILDEINIRSK